MDKKKRLTTPGEGLISPTKRFCDFTFDEAEACRMVQMVVNAAEAARPKSGPNFCLWGSQTMLPAGFWVEKLTAHFITGDKQLA